MKVHLTAILAWTWSQPFYMDSFPGLPSSWRPHPVLLLLEAQFLSPKAPAHIAAPPRASASLHPCPDTSTPGQGPGLGEELWFSALSEYLADRLLSHLQEPALPPLSPSLLSPSHGDFRSSFPSPSTLPLSPRVPAPADRVGLLFLPESQVAALLLSPFPQVSAQVLFALLKRPSPTSFIK